MLNLPFLEFALRDGFAAACWLASTSAAVAVAWRWMAALFPDDASVAKVCHVSVALWGATVWAAVVLGLVGWLNGFSLLTMIGALALIAMLFYRVQRRAAPPHSAGATGQERRWAVAWGVVAAWCMAHVIVNGLLRFPSDWDSLEYHIPLVDHWIQTGSLYVPSGSRRCFNPGNNEILGLWLVAPFSGDFFIHLNNLVPAVLLACASVGLATEVGASRRWGHLLGFVNVSHFVVFRQLVNSQNDLGAAACFQASVWYMFRHHRAGRNADLFLGAASLGLLAGTKYYAAGYAALVFATWMLMALFNARASACKVALAISLGLIALGSYWYLRNLAVEGSPFYPRDFFKQPDLLTRICPNLPHTSFLGNGSPKLLPLYLKALARMMGPCQLIAFIFCPASVCWLFGSGLGRCFHQRKFAQARIRFALFLLLVGTAVLLATTPMAVENDRPGSLNQLRMAYCPLRYSLCFLDTAVLGGFVLLADLSARWEGTRGCAAHRPAKRWCSGLGERLVAALHAGLILAIVAQFFCAAVWLRGSHKGGDPINGSQLIMTVEVGATLFIWAVSGALAARLWPSRVVWMTRGCVAGAFCACVSGSVLLSQRWHGEFVRHYDRAIGSGFGAFSREAAGGKICVLHFGYYPFFGSYRQFMPCKPCFAYSPEWLMRYLADQNVNYVAARFNSPASTDREAAAMNECFKYCYDGDPDVFEVKHGKDYRFLFSVRRPQLFKRLARPVERQGPKH